MGKEVRYVMEHDRQITEEEIAMIEAARELPEAFDEDNPPIDPHKQLNTAIVYVTHDQVEAMTLADRIVVMKDGIIQQVGA